MCTITGEGGEGSYNDTMWLRARLHTAANSYSGALLQDIPKTISSKRTKPNDNGNAVREFILRTTSPANGPRPHM